MSQSLEERVAELEPLLPRVAQLEKALEQQHGTRVTNPLSEDADDTTAPASASQLAASVRSIVARLTETPTNFHQATVHFLATDAPQDAAMARRAPLLYAGSFVMVSLQSTTALGVWLGTFSPSCVTSDQCDAGNYCSHRAVVGGATRCQGCISSGFSPVYSEDISNVTLVAEACAMPYTDRDLVHEWVDPEYGKQFYIEPNGLTSTDVASYCEACVRNDGTVHVPSSAADNLAAMGPADDITLVFATFIVAFTIVGELKDIKLCSMAVAHAGDKLSMGWRLALRFLLWMRRWVFLPVLVMNVPFLVLIKGGDALSVCLNAVAILFLCDIDNIAFRMALGERVRARVEDAGRVVLTDAEASALARTKAVHVVLLVLSVLVATLQDGLALGLVFVAFMLGGVAEAFVPGAGVAETAKGVGTAVGAWLLGIVGICVWFIAFVGI